MRSSAVSCPCYCGRQPKVQRGHSKDKRSDCRLLTLGLAMDGAGVVRRFQVFAGRLEEHHTLAGMLESLQAPRAEPDQKAIYDALGIDLAPGGVRKMIVCPLQSPVSTRL